MKWGSLTLLLMQVLMTRYNEKCFQNKHELPPWLSQDVSHFAQEIEECQDKQQALSRPHMPEIMYILCMQLEAHTSCNSSLPFLKSRSLRKMSLRTVSFIYKLPFHRPLVRKFTLHFDSDLHLRRAGPHNRAVLKLQVLLFQFYFVRPCVSS